MSIRIINITVNLSELAMPSIDVLGILKGHVCSKVGIKFERDDSGSRAIAFPRLLMIKCPRYRNVNYLLLFLSILQSTTR